MSNGSVSKRDKGLVMTDARGTDDMLRRAGRSVLGGMVSLTLAATAAALPLSVASRAEGSALEHGYDAGSGQEGQTVTGDAPQVAGVFAKSVRGAYGVILDGVTYADRRVVVMLASESSLDREATFARLYDASGQVVHECGPQETPDDLAQATSVSFEFADGTYGKAQIVIEDTLGNSAELWTGPFAIDSQRPVVNMGYSAHDARTTHESVQYFDCPQSVPISICDQGLDVKHTLVNGVALNELMEKTKDGCFQEGEVTYGSWEHVVNDDGRSLYRSTVTFGDGTYALPIVQAYDLAGWHAADEHGDASDAPSAFVVDSHAPTIAATTALGPSFQAQTDDGKTALFFSGSAGLTFSFEDVSDIVSAELDDESKKSGMQLELAEDHRSARLVLARGVLEDTTSITLRDRAGNMRVWSLAKYGRVVEAGYDVQVQNAPVLDQTGSQLCQDGHPALIVEDVDAPCIDVTGVQEGAWLRSDATISLTVTDDRLGYLATYDPDRVIAILQKDGMPVARLTAGYDTARVEDTSHRYELSVPVRSSLEDDGAYVLRPLLDDVSGKGVATKALSFFVDTTSPSLSIQCTDQASERRVDGMSYLSAARTMRVTITERFLTLAELNGKGHPVSIVPSATCGGTPRDVVVGDWRAGETPDEFVCDVAFCADGRYGLRVFGKDAAGNPLVGAPGTSVNKEGAYQSGEFVVDTTPPQMTFELLCDSKETISHDGCAYYRRPVTAKVTVTDRNLDVDATTVADSRGTAFVPTWEASQSQADGMVSYVAYVTYCEEDSRLGGGNKVLQVFATDLAANTLTSDPYHFVVDQTAPTIESVMVSKRPSTEAARAGSDPLFFYNGQDAMPATLRFVVSDEHLLGVLWVDDPDDAYDVHAEDVRGRMEAELELTLKDPVKDDPDHDTDFDRDIRVFVQDLVGNTRVWTIDRTGALVADHATDAHNASLDGLGIYPLALLYDDTAPVVRIEGVEAGRYYNAAQDVRVSLDERNFQHVQAFDPGRVVAQVTRKAAFGSDSQDRWGMDARQFEGSGAHYSSVQRLAVDGHYMVEAQFDDMAGNASSRAEVGVFTIDTTAPVATVAWDNNDVRNGKYYNARRTATIKVVEHNFDQHLVEVVTTGDVGPWTSDGDEHTCKVRFDADAPATNPHMLVVRGKDLAGNALEEVSEPEFVIDTQAPTVSFKRRVSVDDLYEASSDEGDLRDKSAFCEAMIPIVAYEDEANLDPRGVDVTLRGTRSDDASSTARYHQEQEGANAGRMYWDNLGLEAQGDAASYSMAADDVYTIDAEVVDLAGNSSGVSTVTFSLNRYGSNFYFDELGGNSWEPGDDEAATDVLLSEPPRIVLHEVNVSGIATTDVQGTLREDCAVTKEHAHASSQIKRTDGPQRSGFTLQRVDEPDASSPCEGWKEYEYVVAPGNFGKGSDSDHGDGGQGDYRVDVSSRDLANNDNTTAQFWGTGEPREVEQDSGQSPSDLPTVKDATVCFSLDEDGPVIEDVDVPEQLQVGGTYRASFHLSDEITSGDVVRVLVDGKPVRVFGEGEQTPLAEGETVRQGTFYFDVPARPVIFSRDVEICVEDYTGLKSRTQTVHARDFRLTTLLWELGAMALVLVFGAGAVILWRALHERFGYTR